MNPKIREIVGTVAPTLAAALGGPLAGVATRVLADKLLGEGSVDPARIEEAILSARPEDLVRIREVEGTFQRQMADAGIDLERIAAADRHSARDRQVKMQDHTPTILGGLILTGFFGMLATIMVVPIPENAYEIMLIMIGALGTLVTQVAAYFFGSSVGSKSKEGIIRDMKGAQRPEMAAAAVGGGRLY